MFFNRFAKLLNHHHNPVLEHFFTPKRSHFPFLPSPYPLATTKLLSVSMGLPILDIYYEWNHTICDLL